METLSDIFVVVLSLMWVPDVIATVYLWQVYRSDPARPRSWLLRMLSASTTVVTGSVFYISFLASYRLLGLGPVPGILILLLSVDLIVLGCVPIYKAIRIYSATHGGAPPTIPQDTTDKTA